MVPAEDNDMLMMFVVASRRPQSLSQELKEYRMVFHLFGATSSPSCASFALRKCDEDNQAAFSSEATSTVLRNFYGDDCPELRRLCAAGGIRLTKWIFNSRAVLASVHEDDGPGRSKSWTWKRIASLSKELWRFSGAWNLTSFEVNRCVKPSNFGETASAQLHHFADTSEKGYGTVTYMDSKPSESVTQRHYHWQSQCYAVETGNYTATCAYCCVYGG